MARENWFKQSDKGWPRLTTRKCRRLESSKPSRRQDRIIDNTRMAEYFKTGMMKQETPGGRKKETKSGTCPSPGTPKRKSSSLLTVESPFKRRKLNFQKSLSF